MLILRRSLCASPIAPRAGVCYTALKAPAGPFNAQRKGTLLMKNTLIFDLDGTLLNTLDDLTDAVNHALERHGFAQRESAEVASFLGHGFVWLIDRALPEGVDETAKRAVLEDFRTCYMEHCMSTVIYKQNKFHPDGVTISFSANNKIGRFSPKYTDNNARYTFNDIIGENALMLETIKRSRIAAQSDSNILIQGESGAGKDVFAQAIHNGSKRSHKPFVAINCAAFSKELIASELFGYESGAFTGAKREGSIGKFELANHGTLFLDEIGDMTMTAMQMPQMSTGISVVRKVGSHLAFLHASLKAGEDVRQPATIDSKVANLRSMLEAFVIGPSVFHWTIARMISAKPSVAIAR